MNKQNENSVLSAFLKDYVFPLTDEELQKEVWIEGHWEKWLTFDEFFMVFCDFCEPILENPQEYDIEAEKLDEIKKLYDLLETCDDDNPEIVSLEDYKRLLKDPKWKEIQEQAKKIKAIFRQ